MTKALCLSKRERVINTKISKRTRILKLIFDKPSTHRFKDGEKFFFEIFNEIDVEYVWFEYCQSEEQVLEYIMLRCPEKLKYLRM